MTAIGNLQRGDAVPHWHLTTHDGRALSYVSIWQHRNLVLVTIAPAADANSYAAVLTARQAEFDSRHAECVITRDHLSGLPVPGALVADRWGEIVHVWTCSGVDDLPSADQLLDWLDYVVHRCPECEGESK
jgi:trans-aconitate methyltransferase